MFTDIEGSTRLHQRLEADFPRLIAEHNALLTDIVERYDGVVVAFLGDGVFAAFGECDDAVRAAAEIQREVRARSWPGGTELRVRIGLHRGPAQPQEGNYVALAVHQAARVVAAAYGGQVLATADVTEAAQEMAAHWRDVGSYRLKDFDDGVRLAVLVVPGLDEAYDGVRAMPAAAHNVPAMRTSFVGREADLRDAAALLSGGARLVTLLGPGGVGKTRLSFELAKELSSVFADGAWVALLANAHQGEVTTSVLRALNLPQRAGLAPRRTLIDALASRRCLLVLDNCEQVTAEVADLVTDVLDGCAGVSVLVTSREPLRLPDEAAWRLAPLPPTSEAVELFVQRAMTRNPRLTFTDDDYRTIERVCCAVDGLPLAVELAAGRLSHMPLRQLADGLDDRLGLLVATDRTVEDRQRTVHALVDWSYSLLDGPTRRLLRQLSVFRGFIRPDSIAAVAGSDVTNDLPELVDKSLVTLTDDPDRPYRVLVLIRDFAELKLAAAGESDEARCRHLDWHLALARDIERGCDTADVVRWVTETDAAYDDLLAAMEYAEGAGRGDDFATIAVALFQYFIMRGRLSEGRRALQQAATVARDPSLVASARSRAGELAVFQGDVAPARELCATALQEAVELRDAELVAAVHSRLAHVYAFAGDFDRAAEHARAATQSTVARVRVHALNSLGALAFFQDDFDAAERFYREGHAIATANGLLLAVAIAEMNLSEVLIRRGELEEAEQRLHAAIPTLRAIGKTQLHEAYEHLCTLYTAKGDAAQAAEWRERAIRVTAEIGDVEAHRRLSADATATS